MSYNHLKLLLWNTYSKQCNFFGIVIFRVSQFFLCHIKKNIHRDDVDDNKVIKKVMKNCRCNDYESFFNNSESNVI